MYELDKNKLEASRVKLEKVLEECGRAPVVVPLGRDQSGIWHYRVITVRPDHTISDQVASIGQHGDFEFAGCTCTAGEHEHQCYQVAAAYPVHLTYKLLWPEPMFW